MTGDKPRRETRSARKRAAIIEAAAAAFRDEGYEAASMDRIAALAGVSKRTVYNHFGSKDALLGVVFEHFLAQVTARTRIPWDPSRSVSEQLREFAAAKLAMIDDPLWMGLMRMALGVFIQRPELAEQTAMSASASDDGLAVWLRMAHGAGRLQVEDPGRASSQFWALIKGELFWPSIFSLGAAPPDERRAAIVDAAIELFLCRYGAPAESASDEQLTDRGAS